MTVGITELPPEGMQLGGVALAGDAERGTKTTEGLSLLFTTAGITVQGPQPQIERLLVWSGLDSANCREKVALPDGRNAAVMELTSGGQAIRFLLPLDTVTPGQAAYLDQALPAWLARYKGTSAACGRRRHRRPRRHGHGGTREPGPGRPPAPSAAPKGPPPPPPPATPGAGEPAKRRGGWPRRQRPRPPEQPPGPVRRPPTRGRHTAGTPRCCRDGWADPAPSRVVRCSGALRPVPRGAHPVRHRPRHRSSPGRAPATPCPSAPGHRHPATATSFRPASTDPPWPGRRTARRRRARLGRRRRPTLRPPDGPALRWGPRRRDRRTSRPIETAQGAQACAEAAAAAEGRRAGGLPAFAGPWSPHRTRPSDPGPLTVGRHPLPRPAAGLADPPRRLPVVWKPPIDPVSGQPVWDQPPAGARGPAEEAQGLAPGGQGRRRGRGRRQAAAGAATWRAAVRGRPSSTGAGPATGRTDQRRCRGATPSPDPDATGSVGASPVTPARGRRRSTPEAQPDAAHRAGGPPGGRGRRASPTSGQAATPTARPRPRRPATWPPRRRLPTRPWPPRSTSA